MVMAMRVSESRISWRGRGIVLGRREAIIENVMLRCRNKLWE